VERIELSSSFLKKDVALFIEFANSFGKLYICMIGKSEWLDDNSLHKFNLSILKRLRFFILMMAIGTCNAQNLVPNGGFELYTGCPYWNWGGQLDSCMFWLNPTWPLVSMPGGSPDYYNQCVIGILGVPDNYMGHQQAHLGNAYVGISLGDPSSIFHEYIEVPLTSPLVADSFYHFEMYVNLANKSRYNTDDFQVYFLDTVILGVPNAFPLSSYAPQISNQNGHFPDTMNWALVCGDLRAAGGEQFMIIGNFKMDTNTTFVMNNYSATAYAYCYFDDVSLVHVPENTVGLHEKSLYPQMSVSPNPVRDILTIKVNNNEALEVILYSVSAEELKREQFTNSITIQMEGLAQGIYFYHIKNNDVIIRSGKIVKL
jgi:hypothetical protein